MRETTRKRAILQMLENHGPREYQEYGPPPYNAATIAEQIGGSLPSVARTLRTMAKAGQLVAVKDRQEIWNAIAQTHIEMPVTAYYSASTMDMDLAKAAAWKGGADERSRRALDGIAAAFAGQSIPLPAA